MDDVESPPVAPVKKPRHGMPYLKFLPAENLLNCFSADMNDATIALALGTSRHRVHDFRKHNFHITWLEADRYAIRIGLHPFFVWGDLWTQQVSPVDKQVRPEVG